MMMRWDETMMGWDNNDDGDGGDGEDDEMAWHGMG
jgi:hypothetical protein